MNALTLGHDSNNKLVVIIGCGASWLWITINFINNNISEIITGTHGSITEVYVFVGVMFIGSLIIAKVIGLTRPTIFVRSLSTLTALALFSFVFYAPTRHALVVVLGWPTGATVLAGILILMGLAATWALTSFAEFRFALSVLALVALLIPAASLGTHIMSYRGEGERSGLNDTDTRLSEAAQNSGRENLYYIITDEYARADVLKDTLYFDNSLFLNAMEERGFFVAAKARSNYTTTDLALMSLLEMDYLVTENSPPYTNWLRFYPAALNAGVVPRSLGIFRRMGYRTIRVSNGWGGCYESGFSECYIGERARHNKFFTYALGSFIRNTPLTQIFNYMNKNIQGKSTIDAIPAIERILATSLKSESLFLFAHHFPPHSPYKYNADCSPLKSSASEEEMTLEAKKEFYRDAVSCTNVMILKFVDTVIKNDPTAVIVIQADHGSPFQWDRKLRLSEVSDQALHERSAILNVIRMPERCQRSLYPEIGNVNTMRAVVGCILRKDLSFVEDRSFLNVYEGNPDFGKVLRINLRN